MFISRWAKQSYGRVTCRSRHMHKPRIISQIQAGATQTGHDRQKMFGAKNLGPSVFWNGRNHRLGCLAFVWRANQQDMGIFKRTANRPQARDCFRKTFRVPGFADPVGTWPNHQKRAFIGG
eukprot:NODE_5759_length_679_cov_1.128623_g5736_i0.p2 GENE.NODE_5759_length_679_cov_1.128623_g5736_i0~~NODE_5759_length_679_cov_1.128623_g5736_i0.p2  ORF type:complete len:121 (+),score=7.84 NODE_5759_length_679_cov_1.128623_g5736_i0:308-670(+)